MYIIFALCLFAFVAAQQPTPCVTPPQWEGRFFDVNEQQRLLLRGRLTYDALYRRERVLEEVDIGQDVDYYEAIALFDTQVEYVYNFRARNCTRRPITRPWRNFGIRPNATSYGEAYVGASAVPGANILVTLWGGNHTGPNNDTVRTFGTWSYLQCLPVRHISQSAQYGRSETSFYDITVGIHDPNVFIPRPECLTEEEYAKRDVLFGQKPVAFSK